MMASAQTDLVKLASLVATARRLLGEGRAVDLSALPGKVQEVCADVARIAPEEGRLLLDEIESLLSSLDGLAMDLYAHYQSAVAGRTPPSMAARAYGRSGS
ncbi:MAG: hypothetical protein HQL37_11340, partial [Alphaproteobacteria bacterium]|nr:hypothetical protein [Alphaproteobacteria bacterium]